MNGETREQLDWIAFRYLANELSDGERKRFEARLDDDQLAREAVAAAVELTDCLTIAIHEEVAVGEAPVHLPSESEARWIETASVPSRHFVTAVVCGMAGCIGLVIAMWGLPRPTLRPVDDAQFGAMANPVTAQLAVIWSESREPLDNRPFQAEALRELADEFSLEREGGDSHVIDVIDVIDEDDSGSWIEAAVVSMAGDSTSVIRRASESGDANDGA